MWLFDVSVCASRRFISGDVVDVWHCVVVQSSKSLTPAVYDSVGALFRDRYGANCGWAHSLLFAAELPVFRAVIAAGGPTSSGGAMTSARGDDLSVGECQDRSVSGRVVRVDSGSYRRIAAPSEW